MDKTLFKNQYIAVIDRDGYAFVHESRSNGKVVALIPFRRSNEHYEYLARIEVCPAHSLDPEYCSITGGVDLDAAILETAQAELLQEAGYHVSANELISLGEVRPSKSADTIVYLFSVDLTHKAQQQATGDGTKWEKDSSVAWVAYERGLEIQDPLFVTGMVKLNAHLQRAYK